MAKNTIVLFTSQAITWLSSFVLMMFMPRYLGSEEYGRLYLAISLTLMAHMVIDFGGTYFIPKEISRAKDRAGELLANSVGIRFCVWACVFVLLLLFSELVGYPSTLQMLLLILGIGTLWESTSKNLKSGFQGFESMEYPALGAIVERLFITIGGVGALLLGCRSTTIALIMISGTLLNALMCVFFTRRIVTSWPRFQWRGGIEILKAGFPYFLWSIFAVIYYRIDAVMLSLMVPPPVVGWYGAAYRFFDVLMFLPSIFSIVIFPVLSRLWKEETQMLQHTLEKSLQFVLTSGVAIGIVACFFSHEIIDLLFGSAEYGPSASLLQIFSIGLVLVYVDMMLGTTIVASDKQKQWSMVALAAIPVNVGLNYVMIPFTQQTLGNGGIGAAISTVITEFAVMVGALHLLPPKTVLLKRSTLGKVVLSGGIMIVSIVVLNVGRLPWVLHALLALAVYTGSLISLGAVSRSELRFLQEFFSPSNLKTILFRQRRSEA
ncbi:MAG TPA: flippase [Bacteroidota bacterium]|nr:flippase [Bacteroidota bacterium]